MDGRGTLEFMLAFLHCLASISTLSLRDPGLSIYKRGRRPSLQWVRDRLRTRLRDQLQTDCVTDFVTNHGYQKCPLIFFILCTHIEHVQYVLI